MIVLSARSLDSAVKAVAGTGAQHVTLAPHRAGMAVSAAGAHSGVEIVLPTAVVDLGVTHVPAALLALVAGKLPDGDVAVSFSDSRLVLTGGRARFELPTVADAPAATIPPESEDATVAEADILRRAVTRAAAASNRNSPLPVLAGIHVKTSTTETTFLATDRYRATIVKMPCESEYPWSATPMAEAMQRAARIMEGKVGLSVEEGLLLMADDRHRIGLRLVAEEGEFPPVERAIPADGMTRCTVRAQASDILAAADRAGAVGQDGRVLITTGDGEVLLKGQDAYASAEDSAKADVEGEATVIECNARYLADALTGADDVRIRFTASRSGGHGPIVIDDDTSMWTHLIMPVHQA